MKPLIENSEKPWTFRPPPSTLDFVDPSDFVALERHVQSHLRCSHLLVDCAQTRLTEQMAGLEVQTATTIHTFTRAVSEGNQEMRMIGLAAEELAIQTKNAYNLVSKLVDLTLRVKQALSPHHRQQLDKSSALYRAGRPGVSTEALRQLTGSNASIPSVVSQSSKFWLEKALPKWTEVSPDRKVVEARKRGGIPASVRGAVWRRAIGNAKGLTMRDYERVFEGDGSAENVGLIEHDVPRTFHRLELFVNPTESFAVDLKTVLERFARWNSDLGYVQGMSYIAGLLLLNMSPFECWICLDNLVAASHLLRSIFTMQVGGIVQHARIFEMMLSEEMPAVYGRLRDLEVTSDHFLLDWFMTLYCRKLPLRAVARVWDLYLLGGEIELHKVAVTLMRVHRAEILGAESMEALVKVLVSPMVDNSLDEDEFISMVCKVEAKQHWVRVLKKIN